MCRSRFRSAILVWLLAFFLGSFSPSPLHAQLPANQDDGQRWPPVYQRRAFEWRDRHAERFRRRHPPQMIAPPVSAGWFQRPYPYHLDYYRMRYGGSYAPYFGNLYGPPQVVTAPPYFGPYYGGFGMEPPWPSGAWGSAGYPNGSNNAPAPNSPPSSAPPQSNGDSLPPPTP